MSICGQQFWLGPRRVGQLVRFWIDCDMVHLSINGTRIKTVRSQLSVTDLARLVADGAHGRSGSMEVMFEWVAGLDAGKATVTVCLRVPGGRGRAGARRARSSRRPGRWP